MAKNIVLKMGDITDSVVDAIVNAGNTWLKLGSGVSAPLIKKGGHVYNRNLMLYETVLSIKD